MPVITVDLDPANTPVAITIQRPDGDALDVNGAASAVELFGVAASGGAYFDSSGATMGEAAVFAYDGSVGRWFLRAGTVNDQPHLMQLAQARNVARKTLRPAVGNPIGMGIGKPGRRQRAATAPAIGNPIGMGIGKPGRRQQ